MDSQPADKYNDFHARNCTIQTRAVLMDDNGRPLFFLVVPSHDHTGVGLKDNWILPPGLPLTHVTPGYFSQLGVKQVLDGSPPTGLTSFGFSICYTAFNGLRQTDGREICEAVERLVARMVADRTWRRDFGGRDDEVGGTGQPQDSNTVVEEQGLEAAVPPDGENVEEEGKA